MTGNSESRKRVEEARRQRVESFARVHEARREAARLALGHVMSCPSFDDADALLHGLEDAGARIEVQP